MKTGERARLEAYFARTAWEFAPSLVPSSLLVTRLAPERLPFVRVVGTVSRLRGVLPEPASGSGAASGAGDREAKREAERLFAVDELSRERFADPGTVLTYLETRAAGEPVVLLDAGGCFAPSLDVLCERFSGTVLGVVEDSDSGHRRYAAREKLPCPVVSVARSPLREPEEFLLGQSVVSAAEALLRGWRETPGARPALVLGFGRLGGSVASALRARGARVTVYDTDPERRAQALAQEYAVVADRAAALETAALVVCASGVLALRGEDFRVLPDGAFVTSVTGPAEAPDLSGLPDDYSRYTATRHVTRYEADDHYFYLHDAGAAVGVTRGAGVDPYPVLAQAETLAALRTLADGRPTRALHEVPPADRRKIAALWLHYYSER
ncbi:NAD-binding protein [Streptomyces sp. PsTaAH-124]|uniref:NAD-binding protein n=1 Tax=Streptomyces sp. PsTaAH-124 TaxID=1157638 RepID=UPI000373F6F3|nr:NAD-binding protein [Streptomyces sp. PsTaAH-124]